ncbi:MAG: hypothetical protein ABSB22_24655 [Thermodesulfobacteriota bacterium]
MKTCFLLITGFMLLTRFASAEEYTRSYEFKPIHIERNQLLKTATEIFLYVKRLNGEAVKSEGYIELGRFDYSTKLDLPLEQNDYEKFPRVSYDSFLSIKSYEGTISSVDLRLSDYSRKLSVTGTSYDHVTGLINVIQEKLGFYESHFGGSGFRVLLYFLSFALFILACAPNWFRLKDRDYFIIYGMSIIIFNVVVFLPPWSKVFPGFLAGLESRSFLERNAALFTFLGLMMTLLIPALTFFMRHRRKKTTPNNDIETDA